MTKRRMVDEPNWLMAIAHLWTYASGELEKHPKKQNKTAHLSKQAKGQTHHLNKPDCLKLVNYDRLWFKVKEWSWPTLQNQFMYSFI